jgi:membrane protein YdbS with pleckstrin-like domain
VSEPSDGASTGSGASSWDGIRAFAALEAPDAVWRPVSPRLASYQRLSMLFQLPFAAVAAVAAGVFLATWVGLLVGALWLAGIVWALLIIGRAVRSWGYAERDGDLLIRRGLLIRRLSVVPYGRMQFVDVTAGPIQRAYRLATVKLHTAAAGTDAEVPGLDPDEAARLRDRLAALGETQAAGL